MRGLRRVSRATLRSTAAITTSSGSCVTWLVSRSNRGLLLGQPGFLFGPLEDFLLLPLPAFLVGLLAALRHLERRVAVPLHGGYGRCSTPPHRSRCGRSG